MFHIEFKKKSNSVILFFYLLRARTTVFFNHVKKHYSPSVDDISDMQEQKQTLQI